MEEHVWNDMVEDTDEKAEKLAKRIERLRDFSGKAWDAVVALHKFTATNVKKHKRSSDGSLAHFKANVLRSLMW